MMKSGRASAYDQSARCSWQTGQVPGYGGPAVRAAGGALARAYSRLKPLLPWIFSTMAVVELFSTSPSTRTSPP